MDPSSLAQDPALLRLRARTPILLPQRARSPLDVFHEARRGLAVADVERNRADLLARVLGRTAVPKGGVGRVRRVVCAHTCEAEAVDGALFGHDVEHVDRAAEGADYEDH